MIEGEDSLHRESTKFNDPDWMAEKGMKFIDSLYGELIRGSAEVDQKGAFEFLEGRLKILFPELEMKLREEVEVDSFEERVAVVHDFLCNADFFRTYLE